MVLCRLELSQLVRSLHSPPQTARSKSAPRPAPHDSSRRMATWTANETGSQAPEMSKACMKEDIEIPSAQVDTLPPTQHETDPIAPALDFEMQETNDPALQRALADAERFEEMMLAPAAKACTAQVAAAKEGEGSRVPMEGYEAKATQLEGAINSGDADVCEV